MKASLSATYWPTSFYLINRMRSTLEIQVQVQPLPLSPTASRALTHLSDYDWILFTSKNAVTFFVDELRSRRISLPASVRVAAVGPETARALRAAGLRAAIVPKHPTVSDMIRRMGKVEGARILFPRSAIAPSDAIQALRKKGASVRVVPLYTTVAHTLSPRVKSDLLKGSYTRLSFKSPSGVEGLLRQLSRREKEIVLKFPAVCIGPTTRQAAQKAGFRRVLLQT
jgi:uroporphyrinogen-III synthase